MLLHVHNCHIMYIIWNNCHNYVHYGMKTIIDNETFEVVNTLNIWGLILRIFNDKDILNKADYHGIMA